MRFQTFFKSVLFITFALWFGGFLFYSGFVISNAHAVLKDHEMVGMITQRVTPVLNFTGAVAVVLLFINHFKEIKTKLSLTLLIVIISTLIAQFFLHFFMSRYINLELLELTQHKKFYRLHRIYLILSTIQFFSLTGYIPVLIKSWSLKPSV